MTNDPEIKVTRIKNRWHARLIKDGIVLDEMACELRVDIGYICRTMLRWYDKAGNCSKFANAARKRNIRGPYGKIWWSANIKWQNKRN